MTGKPLSREEIDDRRRLYVGVPEKWGDPADVVQARWVATVDARDARIADLEEDAKRRGDTIQMALDSRDKAERYSDEVSAERDAAVKRAEEAEAELQRDWYREAHEALEAKEAAEQREAAALASLEALREAVAKYRAAEPADRKPETYKARRDLFAALAITTEGAGKVLARCSMHGSAWVAKSGGGCVECMATAEAKEMERVRGGDDG